MGVTKSPGPLSNKERVEQEFARLRQAFYEFMRLPDPQKRPARRLLGLYADLADKTPVPSANFDGASIWFHVENPLSQDELLYAIETTFALHNLTIIAIDDTRIRLGHISEARANKPTPSPSRPATKQ
jgi:hypothetical protein